MRGRLTQSLANVPVPVIMQLPYNQSSFVLQGLEPRLPVAVRRALLPSKPCGKIIGFTSIRDTSRDCSELFANRA